MEKGRGLFFCHLDRGRPWVAGGSELRSLVTSEKLQKAEGFGLEVPTAAPQQTSANSKDEGATERLQGLPVSP